jgi:hypothetical protein
MLTTEEVEKGLEFLFAPNEPALSLPIKSVMLFSKKIEYSSIAAELTSYRTLTKQILIDLAKRKKLKAKHVQFKVFPANTNVTNYKLFINQLNLTHGFLFNDKHWRNLLFRSLYYIFFVKSANLHDRSILIFIKNGWLRLDFPSLNLVSFMINFESGNFYFILILNLN